jgi:hypothetical protein
LPRDTVLVTGLPVILEYPPALLPSRARKSICVDFSVRALEQPVPKLRITTAGMADALLQELSQSGPGLACTGSGAKPTVELDRVDLSERRVRLILSPAAFPQAAAGGSGTILLLQPGKRPAESTVVLRRQEWSPFARASLWFFGIAIPALVTAVLGLLVQRIQKSIEAGAGERADFERFRKERAQDLKQFFEGIYRTTVELPGDDIYVSTMTRELIEARIVLALPRKMRERLLAAIRAADRARVGEELARAFPDHKEVINRTSQGKK